MCLVAGWLLAAAGVCVANQYCTETEVECIDDSIGFDLWWCCQPGETCGSIAGFCDAATPTAPTTAATTSIPGGASTTTTVGPGETTTTVPAGVSTSTSTASGGSGEFVVACNVNGDAETDTPESSGTLPGSSPSIGWAARAEILFGGSFPLLQDRFFPPIDIELLDETRQQIASGEAGSPSAQIQAADIGSRQRFWVKDDLDIIWRQVTAELRGAGTYGNIYVDVTLRVPDSAVDLYVTEFDTMYALVSDHFGAFSDRDGNGKVNLLFYDVHDRTDQGVLMGYFWQKDYVDDTLARRNGLRSNEMDIVYIRGDVPGGFDTATYGDFYEFALSTLIHEYQHLVHFCVTYWDAGEAGGMSDIWINEMMSMASETIYFQHKLAQDPAFTNPVMLGQGYQKARIEYYNEDSNQTIRNGHSLTYWDYQGDVLANYALSYLFGQYLSIQSAYGQSVFRHILDWMLENAVFDYRAVEAVAAESIDCVSTWEDLLRCFTIANMAMDPEGRYGYGGGFTLTPHGPIGDSVSIHNSGAVYRTVAGAWVEPAGAGPNIRFFEYGSGGAAATTTVTLSDHCTDPDTPIECVDPEDPETWWCCPADQPVCGTGFDILGCFDSATQTTVPAGTEGPLQPADPDPPDGAGGVPLEYTFAWTGGHSDDTAAVTYDIYIGLTQDPVLQVSGRTEEWVTVSGMQPGTTYYWKVVAADEAGTSAESSLWQFTTLDAAGCAAGYVLGFDAPQLDDLRRFRDEVLQRSVAGRHAVRLYYRYSAELTGILARDRALRERCREVLVAISPALHRAGGIFPGLVDEAGQLWQEMRDRISPDLRAGVEEVFDTLESGDSTAADVLQAKDR